MLAVEGKKKKRKKEKEKNSMITHTKNH